MTDTQNRASYLTVPQVATRVGVCHETVKRWARSGRLPARKNISGHWLFETHDIDAMPVAERGL